MAKTTSTDPDYRVRSTSSDLDCRVRTVSQNLSHEVEQAVCDARREVPKLAEAGVAGVQALSVGLVQWGQGLLGAAARVLGDVDPGNRGVAARGDALKTSLRSRGGVRVASRRHTADGPKTLIAPVSEEVAMDSSDSANPTGPLTASEPTPQEVPVEVQSSAEPASSACASSDSGEACPATNDVAASWVAPALKSVSSGTVLFSSDEEEALRRCNVFSSDDEALLSTTSAAQCHLGSAPAPSDTATTTVTDVTASWVALPRSSVQSSTVEASAVAVQDAGPSSSYSMSCRAEEAAVNDLLWRPQAKAALASSDSDDWTML